MTETMAHLDTDMDTDTEEPSLQFSDPTTPRPSTDSRLHLAHHGDRAALALRMATEPPLTLVAPISRITTAGPLRAGHQSHPSRVGHYSLPPPLSPATASDYSMTSSPPGTPSVQTHTDLSLPSTVSSSPLFRLPRELRLSIFAHLLCASPLGICFPRPSGPSPRQGLQPSLLRLNSIVHAELCPLLYSGNRLIFSHPSDANIFVRGLADPAHAAAHVSSVVLRVKTTDVKLWTNYFNSSSPGTSRGLVPDFPHLRHLGLRVRGPRWDHRHSPEVNCLNWLRDPKLCEMMPAVRKCVAHRPRGAGGGGEAVFVEICVRVPDDAGWSEDVWERVVARCIGDSERRTREAWPEGGEEAVRDRDVEDKERLRRNGKFLLIMGCWFRIETEGT